MDEFEYVTDVVPEKPPPPPPPLRDVALTGAWLGALGGFAFLGWESAVTGWLGLQPAVGVHPFGVIALYLGTGALFGTVVGALRMGEGAWASVTMSLAAAWLLSGHLGLLGGTGGPAVAFLGLVALAVLVAYFGVAQNMEDSQAAGVAVALFLALAALLPVDAHHLLTTVSVQGALWNGGIVVVASAVGALTTLVMADRSVGVLGVLAAGGAIGWAAALPVLWTASAAWPVADKTVGPPIVVIVASGLRADRTGLYGGERPTTPNLDAVAARGLVYEDAATHAPWSLPAVASLFTSLLPSHHDAGLGTRGQRNPLPEDAPWLPERLARRGYVTVGITTDPELTAPWGMARGYDTYDDRTARAMLPAALHPWWALGLGGVWASHREAHRITDRALSFVQEQAGGSWFLLVQYADLDHDEAPDPADLRAVGGVPDDPIAAYDARVHALDAEIGRLLKALPPDAIVVFTADHGIELGERRGGPDVTAKFEHSLFQEVVRVPLVVTGPEIGPRWIERTEALLDVAPTLAQIGGADAGGMDGVPLWEVFPTATPAPGRAQIAEAPRVGPDAKSVRQGRYKIIALADGTDRLYDLQLDPGERSPILQRDGTHQAAVRELRALMPPFE